MLKVDKVYTYISQEKKERKKERKKYWSGTSGMLAKEMNDDSNQVEEKKTRN